ncbi:adenine phosphoribosyltransferase [Thermotoga sp. KOL6]|uniref:adenine phosphoribosyltransferase n=1 Tax=Thermotoga sp. KOL6 TaxID=126741 RepID=UPI000CB6D608|nr:adenine phosphoribosyltransferase [Thermotoga sp. KOL6]PLV60035.1 adenine phosphoribosyltransferase [Thermotoga sp. KOL6]
MDLKQFIRDIPDFPQKGIIFRDITPLLKNNEAFKEAIDRLCDLVSEEEFELVVAPEARGFIIGSAMAYKLGKGFVPVRKPGKLPYKTVYEEYQLEYGTEQLHIHEDAIERGQRILIVDDVLATGGTAEALIRLVKKLGGEVAALTFLVELSYLEPRKRLEGYNLKTLIVY